MNKIGKWLLYLFLGIVAVVQVFPILWLFLFSMKDNQEIFSGSPFSLPTEFRWENYLKVWDGGIGVYFWNSVWITDVEIILNVILSSMTNIAISLMNCNLYGIFYGVFSVDCIIPINFTTITYH